MLTRPSPIPAAPGVYGWHFEQSPDPRLPAGRLLYVGIAPRRMATRSSRQNLRTRVRYHFRGNAEGSSHTTQFEAEQAA
ncbi:GIY-YIG nuclease family protein [Nonomuraea sp. NPDC049152]|uniref:GIY-YIG nuclease family protein n=1 Tax=Nonomuraea sp. NPDC049152 TaxID=3154350 RepID=UPI0033DA9E1B